MYICVHTFVSKSLFDMDFTDLLVPQSRGQGRVHRRLVNEAGDVFEDMEVGRHFHVPAFACDVDKL